MNTPAPYRIETGQEPRVTRTSWKVIVNLGLSLALLASTHLRADDPHQYDARLNAMLPPYCKYTIPWRQANPSNNIPEEVERWTSLMGPTFVHMHHYCWGLMATNHALLFSKNPQERKMYFTISLQEFDYVIKNAPPDFVLLPEILNKKGENLIRLGKGPLAIPVLEHAITLKADYWPPYASLGDYYKEAGDVTKARQWLEKGLSASPSAKALERRLAQLRAGNAKPQ